MKRAASRLFPILAALLLPSLPAAAQLGCEQLVASAQAGIALRDQGATLKQVLAETEKGDLRENAEYHAAREEMGMINARIADLKGKLSRAVVVDESQIDTNKVAFGAKVQLQDLKDKAIALGKRLLQTDEAVYANGAVTCLKTGAAKTLAEIAGQAYLGLTLAPDGQPGLVARARGGRAARELSVQRFGSKQYRVEQSRPAGGAGAAGGKVVWCP